MIDFDAAIALVTPQTRLVAIDGLMVSGKSTLADRFEAELGASVVYFDDFLRHETEWRGTVAPAFPFPYFRYDDFLEAVTALGHGRPARYRRYDWETGEISDVMHEVRPEGLVVVEGVSSLHRDLAPLYDLRFWVESDAATTLEASLARGVGDWADEWRNLFMPSAALYLQDRPQQRADHLVAGRGAVAPSSG